METMSVYILSVLIIAVALQVYFYIEYKRNYHKIMATVAQFQTILTRIDSATSNIAEDLRGLKDQIAGQGLPADVEEDILAQLEAKAVALESIAGETPEDEDEETEEPVDGEE